VDTFCLSKEGSEGTLTTSGVKIIMVTALDEVKDAITTFK
jgi:hypothetical protein